MRLDKGTLVEGASGKRYRVESDCSVGSGGQAWIYRASVSDSPEVVALKVYRREWLDEDPEVMIRVRHLIKECYHEKFGLTEFEWPRDEIISNSCSGFVMNFVPNKYVNLDTILRDRNFEHRIETLPLRTVTKIGAMLTDAFSRLHAEGIAYRDLNARNIMIDTRTPLIAIVDTDHTVPNNLKINVKAPPDYRAPEVFRNAHPNIATDRYSLAIILFQLLIGCHPLDGRLNRDEQQAYCDDALFIYDPDDDRNRPNQLVSETFWPALPDHVHSLFMRAFGEGLRSPNRRARENEWFPAFRRLHDSIVSCTNIQCQKENIADPYERACYSCGVMLPRRWTIKLRNWQLILEPGAMLYRWQFNWDEERGRNNPVALVVEREVDGYIQTGLRNAGATPWRARRAKLPSNNLPETITVPPGKILQLGQFAAVAFDPVDEYYCLVSPAEAKSMSI